MYFEFGENWTCWLCVMWKVKNPAVWRKENVPDCIFTFCEGPDAFSRRGVPDAAVVCAWAAGP